MNVLLTIFATTILQANAPTWSKELVSRPVNLQIGVQRSAPISPLRPQGDAGTFVTRDGGDDADLKIMSELKHSFDKWLETCAHIGDIVAHGQYENAYREALRVDPEITIGSEPLTDTRRLTRHYRRITLGSDPLIDTCLLTGRYREVEELLTDFEQNHLNQDGGAYWVPLSLAIAMQGRVYPGQQASATERMNEALQGTAFPKREVGPGLADDPRETAIASLVALGHKRAIPYALPYLEWAMRLDPTNAPAADRLIDEYTYAHRPADAARLAAAMVKRLPDGEVRNTFAQRLSALEARMRNATSGAKVDEP